MRKGLLLSTLLAAGFSLWRSNRRLGRRSGRTGSLLWGRLFSYTARSVGAEVR